MWGSSNIPKHLPEILGESEFYELGKGDNYLYCENLKNATFVKDS